MKWKTLFVVRVYFPDVRDTRIIGQLRNLANEFGRPGIIAKRRQTNHRVQLVEQQRFLFQVLRLQRPNEWSESLAKEGMRRKIERSALFSEHIGKLSP